MASQSLHVHAEQLDNVLVARVLPNSISEYEAGVLEAEISQAAEAAGWNLALDMSDVRFMASSGIGMIITLHKKSKAAGGRLVVFSIADQIRDTLKMTRVDRLFPIEKNRDKALRKFR